MDLICFDASLLFWPYSLVFFRSLLIVLIPLLGSNSFTSSDIRLLFFLDLVLHPFLRYLLSLRYDTSWWWRWIMMVRIYVQLNPLSFFSFPPHPFLFCLLFPNPAICSYHIFFPSLTHLPYSRLSCVSKCLNGRRRVKREKKDKKINLNYPQYGPHPRVLTQFSFPIHQTSI